MHIEDPYVEIIGNVKDDLTIKALTNINLGKNLGEALSSHRGIQLTVTDLKAVDAVVQFGNSSKGEGVLC